MLMFNFIKQSLLATHKVLLLVALFLYSPIGVTANQKTAVVFDDVDITLSDTFERLQYEGEAIGYLTSKDIATTTTYPPTTTKPYRLYSSRASSEGLQLRIATQLDGLTVSGISVSGLIHELGSDELPKPSAYLVGNVYDINSVSDMDDKYPDALIPLEQVDEGELVTMSGGLRFFFDVHVPLVAEAGLYTGTITIQFAGGSAVQVPVEILVWDFQLPDVPSVTTQLFALDARSIAYWYGLDPSAPELETILVEGIDLLNQHRLGSASIPPFELDVTSKHPKKSADSGFIQFSKGNLVESHVAKFDQLANDFTINLDISFDQKSSGNIVKHQWHNRQSGYSFSYENGEITLQAWVRDVSAPNNVEPQLLSLSQAVNKTKDVHNIQIKFAGGRVELDVDGATAVSETSNRMIPAEGGWVTIGSSKSSFSLFSLNWAMPSGESTEYEFVNAFSAHSDHYVTNKNNRGSEHGSLHAEQLRRWTKQAVDFSQYANDIRTHSDWNRVARVVEKFQLIDDVLDLDKFYVSLPHDEAYLSENADRNIQYAKQIRAEFSGVDIFHTFGAMRGLGMTAKRRLDALEKFQPHVSIFSIRPSVFFEQKESFFDSQLPSNSSVSLYVHDVNIVERDDVLLLGRGFFWSLFDLGLSKVSFWNTSLWFQPEKTGRPARTIERRPDGFAVSKRNPSGIGAGMIFYPGRTGLLPSLRSIAWREGLEDYETLKLVQSVVDHADSAELGRDYVSEAKKLINGFDSRALRNKDFRKVARNWKRTLRSARQSQGLLLESWFREMNPEDTGN